LLRRQYRLSLPMALVLPFRLIIAVPVVRFARETVAVSGIAAGAMIVVGGTVIRPVIIVNATVIAGATIVIVIVTGSTSSLVGAARITNERKKEQLFRCSFSSGRLGLRM